MIKINHPNKEELAKEFAERIMTSVRKQKKYEELKNKLQSKLIELEKVILSMYTSCIILKEKEIVHKFLETKEKEIRDVIKGSKIRISTISSIYFNYRALIEKKDDTGRTHRFWISSQLNLNVCPYCNHNYTVSRGSTKDNQLDHFYPKIDKRKNTGKTPKNSNHDYKWLALSFYNLIPSCPNCNQLKSTKPITHSPHIKGFERVPIFRMEKLIEYLMGEPDLEINLNAEALGKNMEVFKLKELYAQHTAEAEELIFKARAYQEDYYESLIESFGGMGLDEGEMHRMIFGNYPDPEDFSKRPLAKFTYDLLQQLGVKPPK